MIKTIEIPSSQVPSRFGRYQLHVLCKGHIPGVLSGAELQGRSREYGGRYAASRDAVRRFVAQYGVTDAIVRTLPGCPRVWVDGGGQPVRIKLV